MESGSIEFVAPKSAPALRPHENSIGGGFGPPAGPTAESVPQSVVVGGRRPDPADTAGVEDAASHSGADDVASDRSSLLFLGLLALLACQHQQLRIGRQYFADGVLKLPTCLDPAPYLLDPFLGDVLDPLFPLHHKGQRPDGMAAVLGTMTGGLAAAEMREREGARESILGDMETAQQLELALTQSGSERASGLMNHLNVYIQ